MSCRPLSSIAPEPQILGDIPLGSLGLPWLAWASLLGARLHTYSYIFPSPGPRTQGSAAKGRRPSMDRPTRERRRVSILALSPDARFFNHVNFSGAIALSTIGEAWAADLLAVEQLDAKASALLMRLRDPLLAATFIGPSETRKSRR